MRSIRSWWLASDRTSKQTIRSANVRTTVLTCHTASSCFEKKTLSSSTDWEPRLGTSSKLDPAVRGVSA